MTGIGPKVVASGRTCTPLYSTAPEAWVENFKLPLMCRRPDCLLTKDVWNESAVKNPHSPYSLWLPTVHHAAARKDDTNLC